MEDDEPKSKKQSFWEILAPTDYAAFLVDRAEASIKDGKLKRSIEYFKQAVDLFHEIERFLDVKDWEINHQEERRLIEEMRKTASLNRRYCLKRINEFGAKPLITI